MSIQSREISLLAGKQEEQPHVKDDQIVFYLHPVGFQRGILGFTMRQDKEVHLKILQEID